MRCFFNVVVFDIWDRPDIRGVAAQGITAKLPLLGAFIVFFARIFLRNSDIIQIKRIVIAFAPPKYRFVPTGESMSAMEPMRERPGYTIAQNEAQVFEDRVE
jgi:hypothetical protein